MVTIRALTTALALTLMPWAAVQAADDPKTDTGDAAGELELTRASIQVARQSYVTSAMDLEPKEAEAFWPLYREYREAMARVNDRFAKLLVGYLESFDELTDETAARMLNEYLSIERARNSVKQKFVPRFSKLMPARKVARFFQVDHKLDAVINAELARVVPLAR